MRIVVGHTWDGQAVAAGEQVALELTVAAEGLRVAVEAPFHGDPSPPGPPGETHGLWNFEVAELFVFGEDGRYLELELGPHGHWLVLELHGVRQVVQQVPGLAYSCEVSAGRWRGAATVPLAWLPPGAARWNAHAIHGVGEGRRYLSAIAAGGARPDFHRPEVTGELAAELVAGLGAARR